MRIVHALPIVGLLFVAACSGASGSELFGDPPAGSNDATDPSPSTPPPTSTSTSSGGTTSPPKVDPPPVSSSGGTPDDGKCTPEEEPNDSPDEATPMGRCVTGKIGTRADVDYATFDPPVDATRFSYAVSSQNGKVAVRVLLNGDIPVGGPGTDFPVAPGVTYVVEVRLAQGDSTARPTYEVKLAYK